MALMKRKKMVEVKDEKGKAREPRSGNDRVCVGSARGCGG
jgi:hypothetical protein